MRKKTTKRELSLESNECLMSLNARMLSMCAKFAATGTVSLSEAEQESMRQEFEALGGEDFYRDEVVPFLNGIRNVTAQ
jgi:hypothetical protein